MSSIVIEARRVLEEHRAALERSLGALANESAARELAETQAAIDRCELGTYGRCERCGGAIGRQRLLALPTARFCIPCAATVRAS